MLYTSKRRLDTLPVRPEFQLKYWEFWHYHLLVRLTGHPSWPFLMLLPNVRFLLIKIISVFSIFIIFILYTTSGRKASQFRLMFPELMRCCRSFDYIQFRKAERGKKGSSTHEKGWRRITATRKNDANFDRKKTLIKGGAHSAQLNRRWKNKIYCSNIRGFVVTVITRRGGEFVTAEGKYLMSSGLTTDASHWSFILTKSQEFDAYDEERWGKVTQLRAGRVNSLS